MNPSGPHTLRQRLEKAASQYAQLLIRRNANPRRKDIKVALFNVPQQAVINGDQNPHRGPAVGRDQGQQRFGGFIKLSGTLSLNGEHLALLWSDLPPIGNLRHGICANAEALEVFEWQVETAPLSIFPHIAENIRQLKGDTGFFRKLLCPRIVVSEDPDTHQPDHRSNQVTIAIEIREGR